MIQSITSKDNKKVKELSSISSNDEYFICEGFHMVEMAIEADKALSIWSVKPYETSLPLYLVNDEIMKKICHSLHPEGILALCKKDKPKDIKSEKVLILDQINDPGNAGTLIRTALSFGFTDIILTKGSVDPYNPKCVQASQGAIFKTNIIKGLSPDDCLALAKEGYQIIGTSLRSSIPLSQAKNGNKIALALGNEARGISKEIEEGSSINVKIEMEGIDSLNVAVAGGIAMYHFKKQSIDI